MPGRDGARHVPSTCQPRSWHVAGTRKNSSRRLPSGRWSRLSVIMTSVAASVEKAKGRFRTDQGRWSATAPSWVAAVIPNVPRSATWRTE